MSEDYLAQQQPTLIWNSVRGVWERAGMVSLLCEHSELFSETWQTSGLMRNGQVFELPMQAHRITDSECSSLPTPATSEPGFTTSPVDKDGQPTNNPNERWYDPETGRLLQKGITQVLRENQLFATPKAQEGQGGALGEETARARGNHVGVRDQAMDLAALNGEKVSRLPTPTASDMRDRQRSENWKGNDLVSTVKADLLPTTRASMDNASKKELAAGNPKSRIEVEVRLVETNWGKFAQAIRRWEQQIGRPAPLPTRPDGKDNAHRLSPEFTEWMMGVPEGWITKVGLTRNEELKACGNGVVPQQAALALRLLLQGVELKSGPEEIHNP